MIMGIKLACGQLSCLVEGSRTGVLLLQWEGAGPLLFSAPVFSFALDVRGCWPLQSKTIRTIKNLDI